MRIGRQTGRWPGLQPFGGVLKVQSIVVVNFGIKEFLFERLTLALVLVQLVIKLGTARPQALEIVKLSVFGQKQMDDNGSKVHGAPFCLLARTSLQIFFGLVAVAFVVSIKRDKSRVQVTIGETRADH